MITVGFGIHGLSQWFNNDISKVVELVRLADEKGVDQVNITDHLAMSDNVGTYPAGQFLWGMEFSWWEPIVVLSAIAAVTSRIRLNTAALISPLRPALLLAKQLATLDQLSKGRVSIGLGAGWHREEFDAVNAPFETRFSYLVEQVKAMRVLWSEAPASFHGAHINFDGLYCFPQPVQKHLPVLLALPATERNIERMGELADGWIPMLLEPDEFADAIGKIHAAMRRHGRDPKDFVVVCNPSPQLTKGEPDFDATIARMPDYIKAGISHFDFWPMSWCKGPAEFPAFIDRVMEVKKQFS